MEPGPEFPETVFYMLKFQPSCLYDKTMNPDCSLDGCVLTKPSIELFSNIFSARQPERIFFCVRIAFFPPYTERSIMTVRHYERHKVHQVRFT
jgi:hypothetical protein